MRKSPVSALKLLSFHTVTPVPAGICGQNGTLVTLCSFANVAPSP